jgi:hypothetical protein
LVGVVCRHLTAPPRPCSRRGRDLEPRSCPESG